MSASAADTAGVAIRPPLKIAVMISGVGSNMLAIDDACREGRIRGAVVGVLSDRLDAPGLAPARERGIPAIALPITPGESRDAHDARLLAQLSAWQPDLVVLAGYMRILSTAFVIALEGRMLNIHPSLLPRH